MEIFYGSGGIFLADGSSLLYGSIVRFHGKLCTLEMEAAYMEAVEASMENSVEDSTEASTDDDGSSHRSWVC